MLGLEKVRKMSGKGLEIHFQNCVGTLLSLCNSSAHRHCGVNCVLGSQTYQDAQKRLFQSVKKERSRLDFAEPGDLERGSLNDNRPPVDEIVPVFRRDSHLEVHAGSHRYPGRGVYLLKFDNSYSLWRSKTLYYRVYYTR